MPTIASPSPAGAGPRHGGAASRREPPVDIPGGGGRRGAALGPSATAPPAAAGGEGPMPVVTAYDNEVAEAEGVAALLVDRSASGHPVGRIRRCLARTHDQLAVVRTGLDPSRHPPSRRRRGPRLPLSGRPDQAPRPRHGLNPGRARSRRTGAGQPDDAVDLATFHRCQAGPRVEIGERGGGRGRLRADHLRRIECRTRRGAPIALCGVDPGIPRSCTARGPRSRTMGRGPDGGKRQPSPWLAAAVARVSRTGIGNRPPPAISPNGSAAMRADLGTR